MKKLYPLLPVLLLIYWGCEDSKDDEKSFTVYTNLFGGGGDDGGCSVEQTTDGGYIITGYTWSYGNGEEDIWLIKTDGQGNEEWNQTFGGSDGDFGWSVKQTSDGGYVVIGHTDSFGNGDKDIWLIKTDGQGNEEWNQTFGGSEDDEGLYVEQTMDGGYIITGYLSNNENNYNVRLIKTDGQGNEEWNRTFGGGIGYSVKQTTDGGYVVIGDSQSFGSSESDVWLIKTDGQGNEEWNQTFGGSEDDRGRSVEETTDGGYIITGRTKSFGSGDSDSDVWLIKTDSQGNEEWNQTFGGGGGRSVKQTNDGGYVVIGGTDSEENVWLIKTDSQGDEEWNQTYGGGEDDHGWSGEQTTDGGYIITGSTRSYSNGRYDVYLIKTDPNGNTEPYGD